VEKKLGEAESVNPETLSQKIPLSNAEQTHMHVTMTNEYQGQSGGS
jgi:hypothetical protein